MEVNECQNNIQFELVRHVMEAATVQTVAADVATVKVQLKSATVEVLFDTWQICRRRGFPAVYPNCENHI